MIVLDASSVIEYLFNTSKAEQIEQEFLGHEIYAPSLIDMEVVHVLRRYALSKSIAVPRLENALEDFMALDLVRYDQDVLLPRIWQLRHHLDAYDAAYVALSEGLDATLLTCDVKLGNSLGHDAHIVVVG